MFSDGVLHVLDQHDILSSTRFGVLDVVNLRNIQMGIAAISKRLAAARRFFSTIRYALLFHQPLCEFVRFYVWVTNPRVSGLAISSDFSCFKRQKTLKRLGTSGVRRFMIQINLLGFDVYSCETISANNSKTICLVHYR